MVQIHDLACQCLSMLSIDNSATWGGSLLVYKVDTPAHPGGLCYTASPANPEASLAAFGAHPSCPALSLVAAPLSPAADSDHDDKQQPDRLTMQLRHCSWSGHASHDALEP